MMMTATTEDLLYTEESVQLARAEAERHMLLYADRQLLKRGRYTELLQGLETRKWRTMWLFSLFTSVQVIKAVLFNDRAGTFWPSGIMALLFLAAALWARSGARQCGAVRRSLESGEPAH